MKNNDGGYRLVVRFPSAWKDAIKEEAWKNRRSINSEILTCIEFAMQARGVTLDSDT